MPGGPPPVRNLSIFNGIEEHGWQDGIKFPANFLKQLIDCWYKNRHQHVKGNSKNTVAAGVLNLKELGK